MLELAALLILAHVLGDFYFQSADWVKDKDSKGLKSGALYKHTLVHMGLVSVVLWYWGASFSQLSWAVLLVGVSHFVIDMLKSQSKKSQSATLFLLDQMAHITVLVIVFLMMSQSNLDVVFKLLTQLLTPEAICILGGYLLALKPTSIFMSMVLARFMTPTKFTNSEDKTNSESELGLRAAGKYIGYLERVLIITFVLLNQFAGVGFLLAAKSILRVGDLREQKDKRLTEYVLLGTLLSTTIALAIALGVGQITGLKVS